MDKSILLVMLVGLVVKKSHLKKAGECFGESKLEPEKAGELWRRMAEKGRFTPENLGESSSAENVAENMLDICSSKFLKILQKVRDS